jgi:UTP--glucose-1-phosphate uridylyltransferase
MRVSKAVITAAAPAQRHLPLQTLVDRDGERKSVLRILLEELSAAGIEKTCVVVHPGDEAVYAASVGDLAGQTTFLPQANASGYANAVYTAHAFTGSDAFVHMVSDHLCLSETPGAVVKRIVAVASARECAVSAVQATREHRIPGFGVVAGPRMANEKSLYRVETIVEKPTPTQAEQSLIVPGLRSGYYLGFYGVHVLTARVMSLLQALEGQRVSLSAALSQLAAMEEYVALEESAPRYDLGARYGLFMAQLALALAGSDRAEVLAQLVEQLALRQDEGAR